MFLEGRVGKLGGLGGQGHRCRLQAEGRVGGSGVNKRTEEARWLVLCMVGSFWVSTFVDVRL